MKAEAKVRSFGSSTRAADRFRIVTSEDGSCAMTEFKYSVPPPSNSACEIGSTGWPVLEIFASYGHIREARVDPFFSRPRSDSFRVAKRPPSPRPILG